MNLIGLDINAVGNHEFDEGADELQRMQNGGFYPTEGCKEKAHGFAGADFPFLAANVIDTTTGKPIFRPYVIKRFKNVKVGFIGMTLEGTPNIVSPAGISNLQFLDEAETANRYASELKRKHGVQAIVVVLHEGGIQSVPFNTTTYDSCTGVSGAIVDIVKNTSLDVDMFMTGHTHQPYNCAINADARSARTTCRGGADQRRVGRAPADRHRPRLDPRTRDVASISHTDVATFTEGRTPEADVQSLIDHYDKLSRHWPEPVGKIAADITPRDQRDEQRARLPHRRRATRRHRRCRFAATPMSR